MPLREELGEGLVVRHHAEVAEDAREEARVDQVQDGVLDAAAVEIDRQPVLHRRRIERLSLVPRVGEAIEVPGRVHERVHRVRLAARRAATLGTRGVDELGYRRPAASRRGR
jgi:hypothetical protein